MNVLIFGFITLAIITIAALVDIPDNYQKDIQKDMEDNMEILVSTIETQSNLVVNQQYNCITAWAKPELPEPKLDAIKCPGCGTGSIKKTGIDGVVECTYCGRQFTLRY